MKIVIFILTAAIVVGCNQKKHEGSAILGIGTPYFFVPEFMKGKVKKVTETLYWAKDENGQVSKGNAITWKELDSIRFSHNFSAYIDESGIISKLEILYENGSVHDYWQASIENGKWVRVDNFFKDSLTHYGKYFYDDKGCLVEVQGFRPGVDTLLAKWVITNNSQCQYIKIEYFNSKNKFTGRNEFARNELGRVIGPKYFNKKDSLTHSETITYNDHNLYDSQESFSKGKSNGKWSLTYTYEKEGNWETAILSKEGKPVLFVERSYIYY